MVDANIEVIVMPNGHFQMWWKGLSAAQNFQSIRLVGQTLVVRFSSGGWAKLTPKGGTLDYEYDGRNGYHVASLTKG